MSLYVIVLIAFTLLAVAWNVISNFKEWIRSKFKSTVLLEVIGTSTLVGLGAVTESLDEVREYLPPVIEEHMWLLAAAYGIWARAKTKSPL